MAVRGRVSSGGAGEFFLKNEQRRGQGVCYFVMQSKTASAQRLDFTKWIGHFHANRVNRSEPDWGAPVSVVPAAHPALLQSLREFQLGDGGGPASLIAFDAERFRGQSPEARCLHDLWFAEEAEHSRLLLGCVKRLGGTPIKSHWSFELFCFLRRRLGVSFELQILTLTELSSTSYYSLLRRHCEDPALCQAWSLILRDEAGHVRFHNDRLAAKGRHRRSVPGRLWAAQFWLCGFGAAGVLWLSHGKCLKQLGAGRGEFFRSVRRQIGSFLGRLDRKSGSCRVSVGTVRAKAA